MTNKLRLKDVAIVNSCTPSSSIGEYVDYLPMVEVSETGKYNALTALKSKLPSGLNNFSEGDLLLAKISPCFENGKSALITKLETGFGMGSSELMPIKPVLINPEFLKYLTSSPEFINAGIHDYKGATGHQRISPRFVSEYTFDSDINQDKVVLSLNSKTKTINSKINILKQKLFHLEEYKTALIHNAVTKGLDAKGCRILDGTPEIKKVRLKDVAKLSSGKAIQPKLLQAEDNGNRYLSMSSVSGRRGDDKFIISTDNEMQFKNNDEFVLGHYGFSFADEGGTTGLLTDFDGRSGFVDSNFLKIISDNKNHNKYIQYALFQNGVIDQIKIFSRGAIAIFIGRQKPFIKIDIIDDIKQQADIADFLDKKIDSIRHSKQAINKKIDLLLEYKKSLINEAVSGQ